MAGVAHVYLLRCGNGSLYCGFTTDLPQRLAAHKAGNGARAVKMMGGAIDYAWHLEVGDKAQAMSFEARIKRMSKARKELIVSDNVRITAALDRYLQPGIPTK